MSIIKNIIFKIYYYLPIKFLLKNVILLESSPDFSDNTRAIYDRLIELGYNKKYKLVWFVKDKNKFSDIKEKNVFFIDINDYKNKRKYQLLSKYIIDCNNFIYKRNKYQIRIHLTHGAPIKFVREYCDECKEFDYIISLSDFFKDITCELFHVSIDKVITTGYPRNDILLSHNDCQIYPDIKRNKTIFWLPTYRNHKNHSSGKNVFPYGIPSVKSEKELKELDNMLRKESCLLVIKLHPAEDISLIKKVNLHNIKLFDNKVLEDKHLTIYHYLSNVDALITDYSSIYYDFLITKKPIALAIEDLKEYLSNTEIFFEKYEDGIVGEYIYCYDDLLKFIKNVSNNKDISLGKRMEKRKIYHKYFDNKSSDRVIALLKEKGLK